MNLGGATEHNMSLRRLASVIIYGLLARPLRVLRGLFWMALLRRVRGRNLIYSAAMRNPRYYALWMRVAEARTLAELPPLDTVGSIVAFIVARPQDCEADVEVSSASARAAFRGEIQIYSNRLAPSVNVLADPSALLRSMSRQHGVGAWFIAIMAGDRLAPMAGRAISAAIGWNEATSVIYWDEDRLAGNRRHDPWLKPDWDELFFLSRDGLTGASAMRLDVIRQIMPRMECRELGPVWLTELVLHACAHAGAEVAAICHVPLILSHRRASLLIDDGQRAAMVSKSWPSPLSASAQAGLPGVLRIRSHLDGDWPSVSIIIPMRDCLDLLRQCLAGIEGLSYQGEVEIIIVDNDSVEPETLDYLEEFVARGGKVLAHPGPFNFAAMNNCAVAQARSDFICMLNNDIEMRDGEWLAAMMGFARLPRVGAVGALLLYPDETVQHAGVAVGVGSAAGHIYRGIALAERGNRFAHRTSRQVSVVTAACLLVSRAAYLSVGGLDEGKFAVAFNDVDFCLRLQEVGLRNIYCAEAMLIHHESKSRGSDMSTANFARYSRELAALQCRWHTESVTDPFHHPLLFRPSEEAVLAL